jgi:phosphate transport system permease protein
MTETTAVRIVTELHTDAAARRRLAMRYRREFAFRSCGLGAVLLAAGFLVWFLVSILAEAVPAFTQHYVRLPVTLAQQQLVPGGATGEALGQAIAGANFDAPIQAALRELLPFATDRAGRRALHQILSSGAPSLLRRAVLADPTMVDTRQDVLLPLDDMADLSLKGRVTAREQRQGSGVLTLSADGADMRLAADAADFRPVLAAIEAQRAGAVEQARRERSGRERLVAAAERELAEAVERRSAATGSEAAERAAQGRLETARVAVAAAARRLDEAEAHRQTAGERGTLDTEAPSFLVRVRGGLIKLRSVEARQATGQVLVPPEGLDPASPGDWQVIRLAVPEASRRISDREIAYLDVLRERGLIEQRIAREFFLGGASREPEMAGILVAAFGSFLTLLVTLALSFPTGVAAAIYLEEFAPRNRITEIIEVNINNLAAVPSIVFGLLGLALFLGLFELPRSAPVVGGLVLSLMTLPIIIIASRAAFRAVPPSIKEAALGIGASHQQAVFHHVLPQAMPGILTGTILGMAHALGETAPLLMIGMVAFMVDLPQGFLDAATVLPVQIFMWADFPEQAFRHKTAAAILVLLVFLVCMNAAAVLLRRRFERRR